MRRRSPPYSYILCFAALFALLSVPTSLTTRCQAMVVQVFSPVWKVWAKANPFTDAEKEQKIAALLGKNQRLQQEIDLLYKEGVKGPLQKKSATAKVIFRPASSWNHSLWIDAGWKDNLDVKNPVIAKDSPVVLGQALVGVVDYVGKSVSRVRLITDPGLIPSVRVARGSLQSLAICHHVEELLHALNNQQFLEEKSDTRLSLLASLETLKVELLEKEATAFLAKGELCGAASGMWKNLSPYIRGRGFNYDFADSYGPARDLKSGRPQGEADGVPIALIQNEDLLVTTGMDGVFPEGLHVASVTDVAPLREGAFHYEITARAAVVSLPALAEVEVLPPCSTGISSFL